MHSGHFVCKLQKTILGMDTDCMRKKLSWISCDDQQIGITASNVQ